jgi:transposase-like protein
MIIIEGTPVREVSEQLGVPEGVLYNWKAKHVQELGGSTGEVCYLFPSAQRPRKSLS